jgi:argininosuccinate lyase
MEPHMKGNDILRREKFEKAHDKSTSAFLSSLGQDSKILEADIWVDKAHVMMLSKTGIIRRGDAKAILSALEQIKERLSGQPLSGEYEDVHVMLETEVTERVGEAVGGRLHTARSRNDEVATCVRITLREDLLQITDGVLALQSVLLGMAAEELETVIPGYTHLQHAQPSTLAHHLLAHAASLQRDAGRLMAAYKTTNQSPLGAGALSSTPYPIDPELTAKLLAFDGIAENSMDAVSSRDYALESLAALSILGVTLSRLAEEIVLWTSDEFGFATLGDAYASTSSIMPQKRNPDVAELARARMSSVIANAFAAVSICRGLPLSYNRDLQEANAHLWDATETMKHTLGVLAGALSSLDFHREKMEAAAKRGMVWATDLADLLVKIHDIPFRSAHSVVASVSRMIDDGAKPEEITEAVAEAGRKILGRELPLGAEEVGAILDPRLALRLRKACGGPAPEEVRRKIRKLESALAANRKWVATRRHEIASAREELETMQRAMAT